MTRICKRDFMAGFQVMPYLELSLLMKMVTYKAAISREPSWSLTT